jgi:hypothetical protein
VASSCVFNYKKHWLFFYRLAFLGLDDVTCMCAMETAMEMIVTGRAMIRMYVSSHGSMFGKYLLFGM